MKKVGRFIIGIDENVFTLKPNRYQKRRVVFFLFLIPLAPLIGFLPLYFVFKIKVRIISLPTETKISALFLLLIFITYCINSTIKNVKNFKGFFLEKRENSLCFNGKNLYKVDELASVVIQPCIDIYGFSEFYSIGICFSNKSLPLGFFYSKTEAIEVTNYLSDFCKCKTVIKKPLQFTFFRKW